MRQHIASTHQPLLAAPPMIAATPEKLDASPTSVVGDLLGEARAAVAPALRAAIDTLPDGIGQVAAYHFGWSEADGTARDSGGSWGKGLRSALVLACAQSVGGRAEEVVPAAVAVELMHNASLIHDDLIDGDALRRHRPAVWTAYSPTTAILAGDALLVAAIRALLRSSPRHAAKAIDSLTNEGLQLIEGELVDTSFETRRGVSVAECLKMTQDKTAALLKCACALGARLGGAAEDRIEALGQFGRDIGMAFQAVDDLLGIWGMSEVTGKPALADLRRRKQSLPVVVALQAGTPESAELAAIYSGDQPLTEDQVQRAAELIEATGARRWVRDYANEQIASGLEHLDRAQPTAHGRDRLIALAGLVIDRTA
ncbi:polyprenyl synthetase family protein [Nocardia sp. NPDC051787]|uniref:polyprenyl synthetase family protein n=1 Tax=Nocardia sp. NPDC051787 TaxID=3155415 RepID=UPI00342C06DF